jgi:hypothetical protein
VLKKSGASQSSAIVALPQKSIRPAREVYGFPADASFGAAPVMAMKSLSRPVPGSLPPIVTPVMPGGPGRSWRSSARRTQ